MTRSKEEFATILVSLRGSGEDPKILAQEMTLRKLCYEIEKAEEEAAARKAEEEARAAEKVEKVEKVEKPSSKVRPIWGFLTHDSDSD